VSLTQSAPLGLAVVVVVSVAGRRGAVVGGRRGDARTLAGFIPDCIVLVKRLLRDPRVPRLRKLLLALIAAGRRTEARALAGFIPDCIVLVRRLLRDPRVPWWRKVALALVLAYLIMPIDLVPDFIPVAGQLDDAVLVVIAVRVLLHGSGPRLLAEPWPGPPRSLQVILRFAH
jgi:uncharacterized membrane protein YkvA (DUF1232 family)